MIDAAAYRANEINAKRAIADWRLSNINDPYIFQNQGFPVRTDSFLDLAQILDTMQEGRFDYYMKELGGFTEEDTETFVKVCLDYIDFYCSFFQRSRVIVPLSTLIAHFVAYKKLTGYKPGFTRLLELGPGCGYMSFFLRNHESLVDYSQIESTESFYLLQSHINAHIFGPAFAEHAISRHAVADHGAYLPKLNWHNPFHYEIQNVIKVESQTVCNHFPWWRIGEAAQRRYEIVASNANLNEFSREALFQYLSLIRDVLADDGAIVAQCLGGGPPTYDTIFANMKSAGFVPVATIAGDNDPGRVFVVSNAVFIGEKHPLFPKYADLKPQFPMIDRSMEFQNKMYFLNEEDKGRKQILSASDVLQRIADRVTTSVQTSASARRQQVSIGASASDMDKLLSSQQARDAGRLRRVAAVEQKNASDKLDNWEKQRVDAEKARLVHEVEKLKTEVTALRTSTSWRITAPLRAAVQALKGR